MVLAGGPGWLTRVVDGLDGFSWFTSLVAGLDGLDGLDWLMVLAG